MNKYKIIGFVTGIVIGALVTAGIVNAISASPTSFGGTGTSTPSGILYGDNGATTHLNTVTIGSNLIFSGGTLSATGGGGSGGGTWATTTSKVSGELINYPLNTTDIPTIGSNSTTTAPLYIDPNGTLGGHLLYLKPSGTYSTSDSVGGAANMNFSSANAGLYLWSSDTGGSGALLGVDCTGATRSTQCIRIESTASNQSTFNIQGEPTALGIFKVSSLGDQGTSGSILSLDASTNSNTGQGIYIKANATGLPFNIVNSGSSKLFQIDPNGNSTTTGYIEVNGNATSTFAKGINLTTGGCYAIGGNCLTQNGGTVTSIGTTWPLSGGTITTSGTITWAGLATTSQPSSSNLLVSDGTKGIYGVGTSTLTASSPLTGSFTQVGSGGSLGCQTASGSQAGCLSSTDWTTFNGKSGFAWPWTPTTYGVSTSTTVGFLNGLFSTASSTFDSNVYVTKPSQGFAYLGSAGLLTTVATSSLNLPNTALANSTISGVSLGSNLNSLSNDGATLSGSSYNGSATVSNWALNLGHSNTWTALQQFGNATSTLASLGTTWLTGITGSTQCLHVDTNGKISGTGSDCGSGSGGLTSYDAWTHPASGISATTSTMYFNGGLLSTASSTFDGTLFLPGITNSFLTTNALGQVVATTTQSISTSTPTIGSTLSYSGTMGDVLGGVSGTLGLNLGNANTWTAKQSFSYASTTSYVSNVVSSSTQEYVGMASTTKLSINTVAQYAYKTPGFTIATSTTWTGTSTAIQLPLSYTAQTINSVTCYTDAGSLWADIYHTSTHLTLFSASTTAGIENFSSNNTMTAGEKWYATFGTPASSPTTVSCTFQLTPTGI